MNIIHSSAQLSAYDVIHNVKQCDNDDNNDINKLTLNIMITSSIVTSFDKLSTSF